MSDNHSVLSSEQALDDYFGALLLDEDDAQSQQTDSLVSLSADGALNEHEVPSQPTMAVLGGDVNDESETKAEMATELEAMPSDPPLWQSAQQPLQQPKLDESWLEQEIGLDLEPQWQQRSSVSEYVYQAPVKECQVPNLDDVEKLLSRLEATNHVTELEIDHILEQNTLELSHSDNDTPAEIEEIQEWEIDVSEPCQDVTEPVAPLSVENVAKREAISSFEASQSVELNEEALERGDALVWMNPAREQDFQVLYFDVNGVTFAVPLDELGGIHRLETLNHLLGRPDWYLGLQTSREQKLDVVDTAKWAMPERLNDDEYKQAYQYIVMLGASMWGLSSTHLLGTEWLSAEKVRWREQAGKRPWLAGMVKEKMCALIHVEAMINMLNAGLDVKSLN